MSSARAAAASAVVAATGTDMAEVGRMVSCHFMRKIERHEQISRLREELGADDCESDSSQDSVRSRRVLRALLGRKKSIQDAVAAERARIEEEAEMRYRSLLWTNPTLLVKMDAARREREKPARPRRARHVMPNVSCCVQPSVEVKTVDTLRPLFTFCPAVPFPPRRDALAAKRKREDARKS
jgi:hypothetical protein